jgi:hypothetical protein
MPSPAAVITHLCATLDPRISIWLRIVNHACAAAIIAVPALQEDTAYLRVVALLYADCKIRSGRRGCSPRG